MRPDSQSAGGRRRGGSRHRRSGAGPSEVTRKPQPLTLWQRIVGLFTGRKSPSRRPMRETHIPVATERGDRPPRPRERESRERFADAPRPARKPELVEVTSPKLYVGNLSFDASESDLFELFRGVGSVVTAEIVSHRHTQKSKGFAFVMMQTVDEARRAVHELHDKDFMGRKLVVSGAKTSDVRHYSESDSPDSAAA